jgi:hypothetical protein
MPRVELQITVTESIDVPEEKYEEIKRKLESGEISDRFQLMEEAGSDYEMEYDTIEMLDTNNERPVIELFEDNEADSKPTFSKNSFE